ncbi:MAG: DUF4423 domain-containing protein [Myxococcales bacterium]|nr:DUF4423 domain-containing protein [Myxococcales bacterium]MCB9670400.1 DUF4423 domain-containing protein [Alphaproteobacteria bacterium]
MDFSEITKDLVRAVRAERSQIQVSRRLGYRANVAYSWESGRRTPGATDFFALADRPGSPLVERMAPFWKHAPPWLHEAPGSLPWIAELLGAVRGNTPIGELATAAGLSRFTVSRWLAGRADPRLPDLLAFLHAAGGRALDFVALFVSPAELPSTRRAWKRLEGARSLARASPWVQVVLLALELEAYRALQAHDDAWLAARLDLPIAIVRDSLERLEAAGQVRRVEGRFVPREVLTVDLRAPGAGSALKRHWAEVAAERLDAEGAMVSYNLFTVSTEVLEQVRDLQRAHWRSVRTLVETSRSADEVVLLELHLVPFRAGGADRR